MKTLEQLGKFQIVVLSEISDEFDCDFLEAKDFYLDYVEMLKRRVENNRASQNEKIIYKKIMEK